MLKKVLALLVLGVAALAGYAARQPDAIHVERSATIAAPPDVTLSLISDFQQWPGWSPWEKLDPNMKKTYAGAGIGSSYAWAGNDQVGEGRMTLTGADAQRVTIQLEFIKPFAATYTTTFVAASEGSGTKLTWNMDGRADYLTKLMGIFMPMDKMVGPDFERGLSQLKPLAEAEARKRAGSGD